MTDTPDGWDCDTQARLAIAEMIDVALIAGVDACWDVFEDIFPTISRFAPERSRATSDAIAEAAEFRPAEAVSLSIAAARQEALLRWLADHQVSHDPEIVPEAAEDPDQGRAQVSMLCSLVESTDLLPSRFGYIPAMILGDDPHVTVTVTGVPSDVARHGNILTLAGEALRHRVIDLARLQGTELASVHIETEEQALRRLSAAAIPRGEIL